VNLQKLNLLQQKSGSFNTSHTLRTNSEYQRYWRWLHFCLKMFRYVSENIDMISFICDLKCVCLCKHEKNVKR
jgi:hypothetical protein